MQVKVGVRLGTFGAFLTILNEHQRILATPSIHAEFLACCPLQGQF